MDPLRDERRLANRYIAGLLIIVLLIAGAGFLIDRLLRAEHNTAEIVELAGRQQMLSQRITQLAFRYAHADNPQEASSLHSRLSTAAREMRRTHETLLKTPPAPGYADAADTIYFDPPYRLDERVRKFLGAVEGLLGAFERRGLDSPYLAHLRDREGTLLLHGLQRVVERHVRQSQIAMVRLQWVLWSLFAAILLIIALLGILIFRPAVARLMARKLELHREAGTDPLTGSQNRRGFFTCAEDLHQRRQREGESCALLLLDIDYFKAINDAYGHEAGDRVLTHVVAACGRNLRQRDVLGRLGGEEFAILLPGSTARSGHGVAEKLRALVEDLRVEVGGDRRINCTVSIGVAELKAEDETPAEAVARADAALYRAKQAGRNRVIIAEEDDGQA